MKRTRPLQVSVAYGLAVMSLTDNNAFNSWLRRPKFQFNVDVILQRSHKLAAFERKTETSSTNYRKEVGTVPIALARDDPFHALSIVYMTLTTSPYVVEKEGYAIITKTKTT